MTYRSVFHPQLFKDQVIIVTGGGSGLGRCTAHELASLGAHVVLVGRKLDKLEAVKAEIAAAAPEVSWVWKWIGRPISCFSVLIRILAAAGFNRPAM